MIWTTIFYINIIINTISIPYDKGANIRGSRFAPQIILDNLNELHITDNKIINTNQDIRNIYHDTYFHTRNILDSNKVCIFLGGDHSIVPPGISAINEFCQINKQKIGILWCDAHADFNTYNTSDTKNIHGMPVAILCHHTLKSLNFGYPLDPTQFAYFGVRDIDSLEFQRVQEHDIPIIDSEFEIDTWISRFDKIHISFDIDCIDPIYFNNVNTPVPNGKSINDMEKLFQKIKATNKLISLDIVEFNPNTYNNITIITDLVKKLF